MLHVKRKFADKPYRFSKAKRRKLKKLSKNGVGALFKEETIESIVSTSKSGTVATVICEEPKVKLSFFEDSSSESTSDLEVDPVLKDETPVVEDEIENLQNPIAYYVGKNSRIIVIRDASSIFVTGMCEVKVLCGSINMFGYEIRPSEKTYKVYSLKGFPQMHFKNNMHDCEITDITSALREYRLRNKDIKEIGSNLPKHAAVVACSPIQSTRLKYIDTNISNAIFPTFEQGFPVGFNDVGSEQELQIRSDWYDLFDYSRKHVKALVCGGKSVGKSTILRFMINRLLLYHPEVCVIDLDPGQSEFTTSNCISIVKVKEPLFGPNFTHLQTPERSILQNIDPAYAPQNYVDAVKELCKSLPETDKMPILINTMGFTKGIGLSLLSAVISITLPTTILEIKSNRGQRDFTKPLTKSVILANSQTFNPDEDVCLDYRLLTIPSACKEEVGGFKPTAHLCRDISMLSYFGAIVDGNLSLSGGLSPTYKIGLEYVTVLDSSYKAIDKHSKAGVINANLVALCSTTGKEDLFNCYGFGMVRAVCKSHLYLITPVNETDIEDVTHLVVGMAQIPPTMLLEGSSANGKTPYSSLGCISEFTQAPKRSFIPRKSNNHE